MPDFTFSRFGKPNFLPLQLTASKINAMNDICVVSSGSEIPIPMKCNINKEEDAYTFELMRATCTKDSDTLDCTFYGPGRLPSGKITSVAELPDSSGMCSVMYKQGDHHENAVLPCLVKGDKIYLSVVHAKCSEYRHPGTLLCEYQYLPSMACDCDGPNACK